MRLPIVSGDGLAPWDYESAKMLINDLGYQGRKLYYNFLTRTDLFFAFAVTPVLFMALIARLYPSHWYILGALTGFFDVLENLSIATLIINHPEKAVWASTLAPYFTLFKFASLGITFSIICIGVLKRFSSKYQSNKLNR